MMFSVENLAAKGMGEEGGLACVLPFRCVAGARHEQHCRSSVPRDKGQHRAPRTKLQQCFVLGVLFGLVAVLLLMLYTLFAGEFENYLRQWI